MYGADDFDDFDMEDSIQNIEDQDDDFMDDGFVEFQGFEVIEIYGYGVQCIFFLWIVMFQVLG